MSALLSRTVIALAVFATLIWFAGPSSAKGPQELGALGPTDGPGIWTNVWNYPTGDLDTYCTSLRSYGVRNLYIQTTRSNMAPIAHAPELGQVIDACHRHKIRVIGWAFLELNDPAADAEKMIAAARFKSANGESLDAVAPDLEKNLTAVKIDDFSSRLRKALGPTYPLIAVVYSPLNRYREVNAMPWKVLAQHYNVIAPMTYWNTKSKNLKFDLYDYTLATVRTIREACGRPDLEIHVIGDAMGTSGPDLLRFMKACRQAEATSASIYPNQRPTSDQLASLTKYNDYFETNARFRLAAFRQMLNSGAIPPDSLDPTQNVTRAQFHHMVSKHLRTASPQIYTAADAPIYPREALQTLAHAVEQQSHLHSKAHKRADGWFAAPAMAESHQRRSEDERPLNWLDASVMLVQAGSALR